jgi:hypothetical protein
VAAMTARHVRVMFSFERDPTTAWWMVFGRYAIGAFTAYLLVEIVFGRAPSSVGNSLVWSLSCGVAATLVWWAIWGRHRPKQVMAEHTTSELEHSDVHEPIPAPLSSHRSRRRSRRVHDRAG